MSAAVEAMRAYIRSMPASVCPFARPAADAVLIVEVDSSDELRQWMRVIDWSVDPVLIFLCPESDEGRRASLAARLVSAYPALEFFASYEDASKPWRVSVPPHIQVNTKASLTRARLAFP